MEIAEKIGQLLILGIPGFDLDQKTAALLRRIRPGGIILFARNLRDTAQARKLISQLNTLLSSKNFPLWICADQEGGVVVRLTRGVSVFPGNMALGSAGNTRYAYDQGKETALEWGALGVNVNLAPVLDLSYAENPGIGVRSLGKDKTKVAELGTALIRGMQENGMMATAKHFPGKGLARLDSHLDLPVIPADEKTVLGTEAYPFQKAVDAGVAFLMTSHSVYKALDPDNPATLSRKILHDLARTEMKFQGLLISDDMEMGAIAKKMPIETACLKFLQAGGDQLLVCHTPEVQEKVFAHLVDAVKAGKISEKEIDAKLERIKKQKQQWSTRAGAAAARPARENSDLPLSIARDSIAVVKNEENLIPLKIKKSSRVNVVCANYAPLTLVEEETGEEGTLQSLLKEFHPTLEFHQIAVDILEKDFPPLLARAKEADLTLIFTYNAHLNPTQGGLVRKLLDVGKPAVVCALRNPYDIQVFPQVKNYVVSYGFRSSSLQALAEVLFGKINAQGKLPVTLS